MKAPKRVAPGPTGPGGDARIPLWPTPFELGEPLWLTPLSLVVALVPTPFELGEPLWLTPLSSVVALVSTTELG